MSVEFYAEIGTLFAAAFLLTVIFSRLLIPALVRRRAGQPILEIGPVWHLPKAGTPTMGGIAFIAAIFAALFLYAVYLLIRMRQRELLLPVFLFLYALACGGIGYFDDRQKLFRKQNKGLTAPQKYLLQLLASGAFLAAVRAQGAVSTAIVLPFSARTVDLGVWYDPLALLYLTGFCNALNLTDGLDGLLSSLTGVMAVFFVLWGFSTRRAPFALTGVLLLGAALGFLVFNAHPAKVFMGDTGSLFLGGAVGAAGILSAQPITVLIAGGVFAAETVSVILQVLYFKITHGKRLFLMAPLHHHFEKRGWSEWRVVAVFSLFAAAFAALAFFGGRA